MCLTSYHSSVVGAVLHIRAAETYSAPVAGCLERLAKRRVCTDSPSKRKSRAAELFSGTHGFLSERIDHRTLKGGCYIRRVHALALLFRIMQNVDHCGFYARKAEIKAGDMMKLAVELQDIINVCTSFQAWLGYDFKRRQGICKAVNEKNEARGYGDDK